MYNWLKPCLSSLTLSSWVERNIPLGVLHGWEMFCHTCQEYSKKSNDSFSFVSGCSNFKIESLKSHARSTGHIQAQEAIFAKERPTEAPSPRALLVTEEVRQKMEKLCRLYGSETWTSIYSWSQSMLPWKKTCSVVSGIFHTILICQFKRQQTNLYKNYR